MNDLKKRNELVIIPNFCNILKFEYGKSGVRKVLYKDRENRVGLQL